MNVDLKSLLSQTEISLRYLDTNLRPAGWSVQKRKSLKLQQLADFLSTILKIGSSLWFFSFISVCGQNEIFEDFELLETLIFWHFINQNMTRIIVKVMDRLMNSSLAAALGVSSVHAGRVCRGFVWFCRVWAPLSLKQSEILLLIDESLVPVSRVLRCVPFESLTESVER